MDKINLLIRGHIRNSFDDERLKNLIRLFSEKFEVQIFIHTWNVVQNGISWRNIESVDLEVTEGMIANYFGEFSGLIRDVLIDDDSKIQLHGNIHGKIGNTPCPVIAWKNMYYGKMRLIDRVFEKVGGGETAIQTRFDLMSHRFSPSMEDVSNFIEEHYLPVASGDLEERIRFIGMRPCYGVDNLYMASVDNMRKFIRYMYFDMDRILELHRGTFHQEHISFHERKAPFELGGQINLARACGLMPVRDR